MPLHACLQSFLLESCGSCCLYSVSEALRRDLRHPYVQEVAERATKPLTKLYRHYSEAKGVSPAEGATPTSSAATADAVGGEIVGLSLDGLRAMAKDLRLFDSRVSAGDFDSVFVAVAHDDAYLMEATSCPATHRVKRLLNPKEFSQMLAAVAVVRYPTPTAALHTRFLWFLQDIIIPRTKELRL